MTEIKVQCDCGQKYKFEVEPINGQMPYAVACPICGLDGTKKANAILRDPPPIVPVAPPAPVIIPTPAISAPAPTVAAAPAPIKISMGALAPVVAASVADAGEASAPVATETHRPRLRINTPAAAPTVESEAPVATEPPPRPRAIAGIARPTAAKEKSGRKLSFALGLLGGFVGALIGGAIYFLIFSYSGFRLGLMAIGVGFLAGLGARFLGKEGSNELGVITATLTIAGVLGAQYFVAWKWWHEASTFEAEATAAMYTESVKEAKKVMTAIPNGTDREIRIYLAREEAAGTGEAPKLNEVTPENIKEFRETQLPVFRDLASGATTKDGYERKLKDDLAKVEAAKTDDEKKEDEGSFKFFFMLLLLSKVNLFSLAAGAGLAYKMSTDAPG